MPVCLTPPPPVPGRAVGPGIGELHRRASRMNPRRGLGGDGVRGEQLVLLASPRDVRVEDAQEVEITSRTAPG